MGNSAGISEMRNRWATRAHLRDGQTGLEALHALDGCDVLDCILQPAQALPTTVASLTPASPALGDVAGDAASTEQLPWGTAGIAADLAPKFDLSRMWAGNASKLPDGEPVAAGVFACATGASWQMNMKLDAPVSTVTRCETIAI